jgi:hypothetical protein
MIWCSPLLITTIAIATYFNCPGCSGYADSTTLPAFQPTSWSIVQIHWQDFPPGHLMLMDDAHSILDSRYLSAVETCSA